MGCEIRSSMDTVVVCQAAEGFPVHFDRHAFAADHVVVHEPDQAAHQFYRERRERSHENDVDRIGKHAVALVYIA